VRPIYFVLTCLLFSGSASALDCWIPTVDNTQPRYRMDSLPNLRQFVSTVDQVVRDNPHFKAMPRPIRIRAAYSVGPANAQINVYAYQPAVWTPGACNVVPGADRCCHDGAITVLVNGSATTGPRYAVYGDKLNYFQQPKRTGTVAGFPEFEGAVYMTLDGRLPWMPVTVEEYLGDQERLARETRDDFRKRAKAFGMDPKSIEKAYEGMRKVDAKAAEDFRAKALAENEAAAARDREAYAAIERNIALRFDEIAKVRASFTPAQLAAPAYHGKGPLNLGRADDPLSVALVKRDPDYFDLSQTDRIRLITVYVGAAPNDPVPERLATMLRTKDSFDFQRLAKFLQ
jgi:hypothetical protein